MNRRPSIKSRWRRHVLGTGTITDAVRVLLLLLVDYMDERGYVSVPRTELAAVLRKHPNRVTERIMAARKAGLLDTVSRAHPGRTAVYRAVLPVQKWSPKPSDHSYPQIGDHSADESSPLVRFAPDNGHPPSGEPVKASATHPPNTAADYAVAPPLALRAEGGSS